MTGITAIIELALRLGVTLVDVFMKRSQRKAEAKEKMFEFAKIHDIDAIRNAKLTQKYKDMKDELQKKKDGEPVT